MIVDNRAFVTISVTTSRNYRRQNKHIPWIVSSVQHKYKHNRLMINIDVSVKYKYYMYVYGLKKLSSILSLQLS